MYFHTPSGMAPSNNIQENLAVEISTCRLDSLHCIAADLGETQLQGIRDGPFREACIAVKLFQDQTFGLSDQAVTTVQAAIHLLQGGLNRWKEGLDSRQTGAPKSGAVGSDVATFELSRDFLVGLAFFLLGASALDPGVLTDCNLQQQIQRVLIEGVELAVTHPKAMKPSLHAGATMTDGTGEGTLKSELEVVVLLLLSTYNNLQQPHSVFRPTEVAISRVAMLALLPAKIAPNDVVVVALKVLEQTAANQDLNGFRLVLAGIKKAIQIVSVKQNSNAFMAGSEAVGPRWVATTDPRLATCFLTAILSADCPATELTPANFRALIRATETTLTHILKTTHAVQKNISKCLGLLTEVDAASIEFAAGRWLAGVAEYLQSMGSIALVDFSGLAVLLAKFVTVMTEPVNFGAQLVETYAALLKTIGFSFQRFESSTHTTVTVAVLKSLIPMPVGLTEVRAVGSAIFASLRNEMKATSDSPSGPKELAAFILPVATGFFELAGEVIWRLAYSDDASSRRKLLSEQLRKQHVEGDIPTFIFNLRKWLFDQLKPQLILISEAVRAAAMPDKKKDTLTAIGEGTESPELCLSRDCLAAMLSCFGSHLVLNSIPAFEIKNLRSIPMDKDFLISSNTWVLEGLTNCKGRLDGDTFLQQGLRLMLQVQELGTAAPTDSNARQAWQALFEQLQESLVVFLTEPVDLDRALLILRTFFNPSKPLPRMQQNLRQPPVGEMTQEQQQLKQLFNNNPDVVKSAAEALLRSLAKMKRYNQDARALLNFASDCIRDIMRDVLSEAQPSSPSYKLLESLCQTCDGENLGKILGSLLNQWIPTISQVGIAAAAMTGPVDIFVELTAVALEHGLGNSEVGVAMRQFLPNFSRLIKELHFATAAHQNVSNPGLEKGLYRVSTKILELFATVQNFGGLQSIRSVIEMLAATTGNVPVYIWKARIKLHEAVIRCVEILHKINALDDGARRFSAQYLLHSALLESCWKCASLTAATRRRCYRTCVRSCSALLLIAGVERESASIEITKILAAGVACCRSIVFQRGFTTAIEKILLAPDVQLTVSARSQLEALVSLAIPVCFNVDKKSERSSCTNGSEVSKSSRFSRKSKFSRSSRWTASEKKSFIKKSYNRHTAKPLAVPTTPAAQIIALRKENAVSNRSRAKSVKGNQSRKG